MSLPLRRFLSLCTLLALDGCGVDATGKAYLAVARTPGGVTTYGFTLTYSALP